MIKKARARIAAQIAQTEPRHRAVTNFLGDVGFARKEIVPPFKAAWEFYQSLMFSRQRHDVALEYPSSVDAFPAQELRLTTSAAEPFDWPERWRQWGGMFYNGRMIAKRTDPIWARLSVLGLPYPPFEFGSGMGVRNIREREWNSLSADE